MAKNKMSLFNFYITDELKDDIQDKLAELLGEKSKGQMAALIRVLLKQFAATPNNKINPLVVAAIDAEYTYSKIKNKRSAL